MLLRAIVQGEPGTGKNALLASASDVGYRVIIGSFENGSEVTRVYSQRPENVHIISFANEVIFEAGLQRKAHLKEFEVFLYSGIAPDGSNYGKPKTWGPDTILAIDTVTAVGTAAELRLHELNPRMVPEKLMWEVGKEQDNIAETVQTLANNSHVVFLAHLKLLSPQVESGYSNETELQKQIKRERAQFQETGFFPEVYTQGIARNFARHFPFALLCELDHKAKNPSKRVLRTKPVSGYQIKCPLDVEDKLPIESALGTILGKLNAS